ncbi:MAG: DUF2062 domain-containing protein [Bacillota bacterium]
MKIKAYGSALRGHTTDILAKLSQINDPPKKIAKGAAIGVFWGVLPTFGFAILFAIPTALLLKANKLSSISATFISNPLTTPLFYSLSFSLGTLLHSPGLDTEISLTDVSPLELEDLATAGLYFYSGGLVLATGMAVITYLVVYYLLCKKKKVEGKY